MLRRAFLAALMAGAACSAQPSGQQAGGQPIGVGDEGPGRTAAATGDVTTGPQGPQPAGSNNPVPKDAPVDPSIRNVPATTGKANLAKTAPPFAVTTLGQFAAPFGMAFLPNGALLVTEKGGALKMRRADGSIIAFSGVPRVAQGGQGGLLDVAVAPDFATSSIIYLTYAEPRAQGSSLALMKAKLFTGDRMAPGLSQQGVIWRAGSDGPGGQFGAVIAFAPDGRSLFLSSGERQRFTPAQDARQLLGKIVHLDLDGKPLSAPGWSGVAGVYSLGHRNPYGLAFDAGGRLWEVEMGPMGGDEVNLILPNRNYGWPLVSNGDNYSGKPIPDHPSRPDLEAPKLWWNPSISPGGMMIYSGAMFPQYRGSMFVAALSGESLIRVTLGDAPKAVDQWDMGTRIRDVAEAPDGSIWLLEDGERGAGGKLLRLAAR